ncbi:4729_t:CDS:2 [Funneliformis geosporum]|uniref:3713_t:CDS:1 n=1 Tax=Funneliformis geosporum TaxID=1117311 RepID=A0A9W4SKI4_9GLOM|nr:4729_t:CDS:2 [Funneliformis geosporum]CAI2171771.1 3713_t:CDS:2 [Funneliformis geosporum]
MKIYKVSCEFQCEQQRREFSKIDQELIKSGLIHYLMQAQYFPFQIDNKHQACDSQNCEEKNHNGKCKWDEKSTKALLLYLKEHKKEVLQLECRGKTAGKVRKELWDDVATAISNECCTYTDIQCAIKWKNIKQNHDKSPKYQYKDEVETIICENRISKRKMGGGIDKRRMSAKKARKFGC